MNILSFIDATADDADLLTETTILSKKYWGYSDEQINSWLPELTITIECIASNKVVKVFLGKSFIGFYGLKKVDDPDIITLEHLWLLPRYIGKGHGKSIFEEIIRTAKTLQYQYMTVVADPNAGKFYEKMGGNLSELLPSSIPGRDLPVYKYKL